MVTTVYCKIFYIITFLNETVCTVFEIIYTRIHQNNDKVIDLIVVCNLNIVGQHRLLSPTSSTSNDYMREGKARIIKLA